MASIALPHEQKPIQFPTVMPKYDTSTTMKALVWNGKQDVRVVDTFKPIITEPKDVIIRVTSTTVCGSDLHLFHNEFPGLQKGDILGHEFMGFVDAVGPEVKNIKLGDRVVVGFPIACGECFYCQNKLFSCCDTTNPSKEMEELYGHRISGMFGYSHITGGYPGGQAEYVRVPYADNNCLKVPDHLPDEKVLFLSDIVSTGYHSVVLGKVSEGQTVAVWGCGPVGLMALAWAKFKGAKKLIAIDGIQYRLQVAKDKFGAQTININSEDVVKTIQKLAPGGPDVCIDAAGFRFPKGLLQKFQRAVKLETDTSDILYEAIISVRKAGVISIVGDYFAYANQFPIGAFMEKGLTMSAGQTHVQQYWKELLEYIEKGKFDPTFVISHVMPLERAAEAYEMFDKKENNVLKVVLKTKHAPIVK